MGSKTVQDDTKKKFSVKAPAEVKSAIKSLPIPQQVAVQNYIARLKHIIADLEERVPAARPSDECRPAATPCKRLDDLDHHDRLDGGNSCCALGMCNAGASIDWRTPKMRRSA
mmetsp:Transcript_37260/g.86923  ORF Transcript_37260/g.86923 Transcript_37260/m.86923 type:complete len:113 (-) Transcript_37260:187-525(-)